MVDVSKNKSKEEDIGAKDPTIKSAMDESEQVKKCPSFGICSQYL